MTSATAPSGVAAGWVESPAGDRLLPLHFGDPAAPLFGCLHAPAGAGREWGAVLCPPHGHEYTRSHRAYRHLAGRLARDGVAALRFDYTGCGDSAGESGEVDTVARWLDDVGAAVAEVRRLAHGVSRLALVGRRLGGTLAALHAAAGPAAALVLWDPVTAGGDYLAELARAHDEFVSSPRGRYLGALADAEERVRRPGQAAEFLGQPLSAALMADLGALDLAGLERAPARRILLIDSRPQPVSAPLADRLVALGAEVDRRHLPDPQSWRIDDPLQQVVPNAILAEILSWLAREVVA